MPHRVLVIEDEPGIVDFLQRGLAAEGFEVIAATDGVTGAKLALQEDVAVLVLDMLLPERDGMSVLTEVHQSRPELPVIVLTALGEVEQRVAGLDGGAVDYLVKPFSLSELVARIRAQLRAQATAPVTELRARDIQIDLITREVRRSGERVRLSTTEFELLVYLMRNPGRVLTREQILRAVWGYQHDPETNVVDVYIGYLRRKLRTTEGAAPIVTVRSVGYRLDAAT